VFVLPRPAREGTADGGPADEGLADEGTAYEGEDGPAVAPGPGEPASPGVRHGGPQIGDGRKVPEES
jgi:hypothetical protein